MSGLLISKISKYVVLIHKICFWTMDFSTVFWIADRISSTFWLLHSDLHEIRAIAALEYLSSMVASLEPKHLSLNGQRGDLEKLSLLEQNSRKGKFHVRFKRRNGRVRVTVIPCSLFFFE